MMLTKSLRELEKSGMVRHRWFGEVFLHGEYSLTELGSSLIPVLRQLYG